MKQFKNKETMCGPACVQWILEKENKVLSVDESEVWCCAIAKTLQQAGFNVKVKCFNSKLYEDCCKFPNEHFVGFEKIREYAKTNQVMQEKPTKEIIAKEIEESRYVIYNVSSKLLILQGLW